MRDIDHGMEALVQAPDVSAKAGAGMARKLRATTETKSKASLQTNPQIRICLQNVVSVHVRAVLRVRTHHFTRVGRRNCPMRWPRGGAVLSVVGDCIVVQSVR